MNTSYNSTAPTAKELLIKSLKKERLFWRLGSIILPVVYTAFLIIGLSYFAGNDSTSLITKKTIVFTVIGLYLLALSLFNILYYGKINAYTQTAPYDLYHVLHRHSSKAPLILSLFFNLPAFFFALKSQRTVRDNKDELWALAKNSNGEKLKYSYFPTKKKLMQLYFGLLMNANLHGYFSGVIHKGDSKQFCVPGLNCYSCPGAVGACPIGSLQGAFKGGKSTIFYVFGILALYSVLFGRMICGWVCPFGFIQDLTYKIKTPKLKKNRFTRILSLLKYVILIFFVFIVPIAYALRSTPLPTFCKYICPSGTLEGGIGLLSNSANNSFFEMLGPLFTWKFALLMSIIVSSIFIYRIFCRFLCPLGALYSLFNKFSLFGIKVDNMKCINCTLCLNHCKMDIRKVGDRECINCGECKSVCPVDAIKWKGSGLFERFKKDGRFKGLRTVTRGISLAALLLILFSSIVFFWKENDKAVIPPNPPATEQTDPNGQGSAEAPLPPVGNTEGSACPSFELETVTPDGVSTRTVDPSDTGKITVINFWGTWCTPCVGELPYFDAIATDYSDNVDVIAVHSFFLWETEADYIKENYPDSHLIFAKDHAPDNEDSYYTTLGGRGAYPYTVILDERGVISKIFVSSVNYGDLKTEIEKILNG